MIICGLDTETTGLSPDNDRIIELGAVLWDTDTNKPIKFFSEFIYDDTYPAINPAASKVNGITQSMLDTWSEVPAYVYGKFLQFSVKADYILAHNGNGFDKPFVDNSLARVGMKLEKPWIDSRIHVPYPEAKGSRKLIHLAAELGFVNPFPHRAVTDVLTMLRVCSHFDWSVIISNSSSKQIRIRALVSKNERQKAKDVGYYYDGTNQWWYKDVMDYQYSEHKDIAEKAGFEITEVKSGAK